MTTHAIASNTPAPLADPDVVHDGAEHPGETRRDAWRRARRHIEATPKALRRRLLAHEDRPSNHVRGFVTATLGALALVTIATLAIRARR